MSLVVHTFASPQEPSNRSSGGLLSGRNSYILAYPALGTCAIIDPPCPAEAEATLGAILECIALHDYLPTWILHTVIDAGQAECARRLQQQLLCAQSVVASGIAGYGHNGATNYDRVLEIGDRLQVGNACGSVQQLGEGVGYLFERFAFTATPTPCDQGAKVLARVA